ncbi:MAG: ribbon-helix-helix domain-containing protein [Rhodospirillales bacterium]|nr:ribbon-helix-helix domain-containing protein [Rhodospirillales bacterium]
MKNKLVSKNVTISGRRTSLRLEEDIWEALEEICRREAMTMHELCTEIDRRRKRSSRTSAVRAFIVVYYRAAATDDGHAQAGHGNLLKPDGDADNLVQSSASGSS